ncbi:MAG: hypothetical protein IJ010_00140 [Ruminococcus sp.]|nr:hypothetical protein [Ruminococcus sp.]
MDAAVLISAAVMTVIAGIEFACLFCCSKLRMKAVPVIAVLPVVPDDENLRQKLEYMENVLTRKAHEINGLLLISVNADSDQLTMCREFCKAVPAAVLTDVNELEKKLPEMFAFHNEI